MRYLLITCYLLLCTLPAGAAPPQEQAGYLAFIAVESTTGGALTEGLGTYANHPDEVLVQGFGFGLEADYDPATGYLTGRLTRKPVRIVKPLDALTPLLITQMVNGSMLRVTCTLYTRDQAGREHLVLTLEIVDARLVGVSESAEQLGAADTQPTEEALMVYSSLTVTDERSGTSSTIQWDEPIE